MNLNLVLRSVYTAGSSLYLRSGDRELEARRRLLCTKSTQPSIPPGSVS